MKVDDIWTPQKESALDHRWDILRQKLNAVIAKYAREGIILMSQSVMPPKSFKQIFTHYPTLTLIDNDQGHKIAKFLLKIDQEMTEIAVQFQKQIQSNNPLFKEKKMTNTN